MALHLHLRLKNCLQTILDIESDAERYPLYKALKPEMETLKKFLSDIDSLELSEDDVTRLEQATTMFLSELYLPINKQVATSTKKIILQ